MGPARDLGPCQIEWGTDNLGEFWEGIEFKFEEGFADVFEARFGQAPVDSVLIGAGTCELTVPFTRTSLANLTKLLPGGSESGSSGVVVYGDMVGTSLYSLAKPLFLKPLLGIVTPTKHGGSAVAANGSWLKIEKAYPIPNFTLAYNIRDQRVYNVVWKCFVNATNHKIWSVGKVDTTTT